YIDIEKTNAFDLVAGKYYWKASNDYISGISHEFEIKSEVGMKVTRDENGSELVNIGNVKLNVTKNNEGVMVGYIILEPDSSEKIENEGNYAGGQA
ncbi:MAG: hypothetical protein KKE50_01860, partial [Nanoarchaeota archaeon]|nr:hypothetical protein [Nanoarchaeota archaeon]